MAIARLGTVLCLVLLSGCISSPVERVRPDYWSRVLTDPALNERYQFWLFFYPTMNPILQSASELRQSLLALHADLEAKGEAWNDMVLVHSIIGDLWKAGGTNGSDSVVAYWSSHVEGAASELVVRADHLGLHKHAPAIAEVRRILLENLKAAPR